MATKARRPKGTGTLWHLEGDRWRLMLNAGGKRPSRVFRARNLTEANRAADAIRLELLARHEQGASTRDAGTSASSAGRGLSSGISSTTSRAGHRITWQPRRGRGTEA